MSQQYCTQSPLFGVVGGLAFTLDAMMRGGQRRQWVFAMTCMAGAGIYGFQNGLGVDDAASFSAVVLGLVAIVSIAYAAMIPLTRRIDSTGAPLSLSRVRGGMVIGLLATSQALFLGPSGVEAASIVWATLAGVTVGGVRRIWMRGRGRDARARPPQEV